MDEIDESFDEIEDKTKLRQQLQADIQAFLSSGGRIDKVPHDQRTLSLARKGEGSKFLRQMTYTINAHRHKKNRGDYG